VSRPQAFFFKGWTPAARLANPFFDGPDAGAQLGKSTAYRHAAKTRNLRQGHDTTASTPQRKQARKQTPLPLVENCDEPIDRRVVPGCFAARCVEAIRTRALVYRTVKLEVCPDCSRLP
jgi:hypothetical protein